jgi:hypothetical protein
MLASNNTTTVSVIRQHSNPCIAVLLQVVFYCFSSLYLPLSRQRRGRVIIGIDLGTSYSAVGYWNSAAGARGNVMIVPNNAGKSVTPSQVAFTSDGDILVGEAAKNQAATNPENTIYSSKRLLGSR